MNLYAILSDIHGNFEALEAVAADAHELAKAEKATNLRFVCLGDVVDYGPQPNECMNWVQRNVDKDLFVRGNHDRDVVADGPPTINVDFWPIHLWTRRILQSDHREFLGKQSEWKRPSPNGLPNFTLFHGSLVGIDDYIVSEGSARRSMEKLPTDYGLFGHTHVQGCFCSQRDNRRRKEYFVHLTRPENHETGKLSPWMPEPGWKSIALNQWHPLPNREKVMLNPGSVGQPRRHSLQKGDFAKIVPHDYRAAYLLLALNGGGSSKFQFRRVDYDIEKTVQLLREIRYPEKANVKYASIDYDRRSHTVKDADENGRKLQETYTHIHTLLPQLIENTLIPTLREGH